MQSYIVGATLIILMATAASVCGHFQEIIDIMDYNSADFFADLASVLTMESSSATEDGWTQLDEHSNIYTLSKTHEGELIHLVKGYLNFPNIPSTAVAAILNDIEARPRWDINVRKGEILETHPDYLVVYWQFEMPMTMTTRDVVQKYESRYDDASKTTYIVFRNTTHSSRPELAEYVRAESKLSGIIIRPAPDDPSSTHLSLIVQCDLKTWIPDSWLHSFMASTPNDFQQGLTDYYWNVYSKQQPQI